jgi:hypothetical protein
LVAGSWQEDSTSSNFSHNGNKLGSIPSFLYTARFLRLLQSMSYARQEEKWSSREAAILLGELQEDDRKRHIVTSLPSWYINFDFYSFLPETTL